MVFSSITFLFYFLPITFIAYYLLEYIFNKSFHFKNALLLISSLFFILFGSGSYVVIILLTTLSSYIFGKLIFKNESKILFAIGLLIPLTSLIVFKYANFLTFEANQLVRYFGLGELYVTNYILPIGISFYTFQNMSYLMDVKIHKVKPEENYFDLLLYIAMFPQLIAGPIVRYTQINEELHNRKTTVDDFVKGSSRFIYGLAKKVIIADACGALADIAYQTPNDELTSGIVYLGAITYFLQIYFDFSAYSDMAIGLGNMLGFKFPENFNRPYSSNSLTDFWRRWHITLSSWFRDYLYIPLGGSKKGEKWTYINLWIVFLVTGIWHGANWTFIIWGIYNGLILSAERFFNIRSHDKMILFWRVVTLFLVILGWIMFRAESLEQAIAFYAQIFTFTSLDISYELWQQATPEKMLYIIIGLSSLFFPKTFVVGKLIEENGNKFSFYFRCFIILFLLPFTLIVLSGNNYSPFIYFQF